MKSVDDVEGTGHKTKTTQADHASKKGVEDLEEKEGKGSKPPQTVQQPQCGVDDLEEKAKNGGKPPQTVQQPQCGVDDLEEKAKNGGNGKPPQTVQQPQCGVEDSEEKAKKGGKPPQNVEQPHYGNVDATKTATMPRLDTCKSTIEEELEHLMDEECPIISDTESETSRATVKAKATDQATNGADQHTNDIDDAEMRRFWGMDEDAKKTTTVLVPPAAPGPQQQKPHGDQQKKADGEDEKPCHQYTPEETPTECGIGSNEALPQCETLDKKENDKDMNETNEEKKESHVAQGAVGMTTLLQPEVSDDAKNEIQNGKAMSESKDAQDSDNVQNKRNDDDENENENENQQHTEGEPTKEHGVCSKQSAPACEALHGNVNEKESQVVGMAMVLQLPPVEVEVEKVNLKDTNDDGKAHHQPHGEAAEEHGAGSDQPVLACDTLAIDEMAKQKHDDQTWAEKTENETHDAAQAVGTTKLHQQLEPRGDDHEHEKDTVQTPAPVEAVEKNDDNDKHTTSSQGILSSQVGGAGAEAEEDTSSKSSKSKGKGFGSTTRNMAQMMLAHPAPKTMRPTSASPKPGPKQAPAPAKSSPSTRPNVTVTVSHMLALGGTHERNENEKNGNETKEDADDPEHKGKKDKTKKDKKDKKDKNQKKDKKDKKDKEKKKVESGKDKKDKDNSTKLTKGKGKAHGEDKAADGDAKKRKLMEKPLTGSIEEAAVHAEALAYIDAKRLLPHDHDPEETLIHFIFHLHYL